MKGLATLKPPVADTGLGREDDRMHQTKLSGGGAGVLTRSCFLECLPYPQFISRLEEGNECHGQPSSWHLRFHGVSYMGRLSFISDDISCR